MFVSKLPYIIFRDYPEYGYLTDNRNFGYDTASESSLKVGDLLISKMGSVFYSQLTSSPQDLCEIVQKLYPKIEDVSWSELFNDAVDFYTQLAENGFVRIGEIKDPPIRRSDFFSYSKTEPLHLALPVDNTTTYDNVFNQTYRLTRVHIDISSRCNERCVHCYIPHELKTTIMSEKLFFNILEQCRINNILNVTISGGEPMLNPNLLKFLCKCREYNFSVNLLSNLTLLTDELVDTFLDNALLSVQTSLYSMNPEIHDCITKQKGSYEKTLKAILKLCEYNIPMQINCPIMKQNKDSYQDVLDWARALNIDASSDYMLFGCYDRSQKNLDCRLSEEEVENLISHSRESIPGEIQSFVSKKDEDHICTVCENSICISNTGDFYPCEGWQSFKLGNIKEVSLLDIWEKSTDVSYLRNIRYKDFPLCRNCSYKSYCNICLIRNVNESATGSLYDVNPYFCKVAELKRKYH